MPEPVRLESESVVVDVFPELGGRVQSFFDKEAGREWFWRNPSLDLYACDVGDDYDANWQGGFEELFPNDAVTRLDGLNLPDHGELWSAMWEVNHRSDQAVSMSVRSPITGVHVTKALAIDGSQLRVAYELHNEQERNLPYLFKLHPAVAVDEECELELPGGRLEPVDPDFGNILPDGATHPWPGPPGHEVARCHSADSGLREFVYVHDVPEGWVGVHDRRLRRRLRLSYPKDVFPYCWLFLTYGGWNDHHVAVLEPCTTYPKNLPDAIRANTTPSLKPGETRRFDVSLDSMAA